MISGTSLINNEGPRIEPWNCGAALMWNDLEVWPFITTFIKRFVKNEWIKPNIYSEIHSEMP